MDVYTVCTDGSQLTNLTNDSFYESYPSWSPDGTQIAFTSTRTGKSQIHIMNEDGSNLTQLTSDYENDFPIWLPDGRQVAFRTTDREGLWWWRIINTKNNRISEFSTPSYDYSYQTPAWSPNGKYIAYMWLDGQRERKGASTNVHLPQIHIHKQAVNGSSDIPLTNDGWANINPVWSPNGEKIAFLSERDGTYNIFALYVMNNDGTNLQKLSEPVYRQNVTFSWSPDGQQIVIAAPFETTIYIIDVKTGNSRELLKVTNGIRVSAPSWQP